MRKSRKKEKLSSQYLIKTLQVFEKNKWEIESTEEAEDSLFNRYCERLLAIGENKKRDLMIELTEHYLWLQEDDYTNHLIIALIKLIQMKPEINEKTKIYVLPLIAPDDRGKTKSSSMLVYLFNSVKIRHNSKLSKYKFEIVEPNIKIESLLRDDNSILLLADDFIGTGETAEKCILDLLSNNIDLKQMCIVSLVAQEMGIEYLKGYDLCVVSSIIRKRGITDYFQGDALHNKIELMKQIEDKMSVKEKYKFGYKNSESLVTMCRTPNNTFPLFWEENGNIKIAPFPRF